MRMPGIVLPISVSFDLLILKFYSSPASLSDKKRTSTLVVLSPPLFGGRRISAVAFGSAVVVEPQGCFAQFIVSELRRFFAPLRMTALAGFSASR
jgi:hypothetical protein